MKPGVPTIRLTVAQAIIRFLANQVVEVEGRAVRVCPGGFGIFGHGNAPALGEALYEARDVLPLYRGHAWWEVGTAEISPRPEIAQARASIEAGRRRQQRGG